MQISKTLLALGAVALCAGTVSSAAPDTEAQAKARAALYKKMAELDAQPWAGAAPAAAVATPVQIERSRESVRQEYIELNPHGDGAILYAPTSPPAGSARATSEQIERSRELVHQRLAELDAPQKAPSTPPPVVVAPPSQPAPPVVVPEPKTKQERLADLLKLYQADTISPEQYHKERAKIVAEP